MNVFTSFHKLTNECPNIFVQTNFIRTNVQINLYIKIDTNVCPNKYLLPIYLNIQIFEYIRHTLFPTLNPVELNPVEFASFQVDQNPNWPDLVSDLSSQFEPVSFEICSLPQNPACSWTIFLKS